MKLKMSNFSLFAVCLIVTVAFVANSVKGHNGHEIGIYNLKRGDFELKVTNFGARIISVLLPDQNGNTVDVVLGYDCIKDYLNDTRYFGAMLGRVANRIGGAKFYLNGVQYKLDPNEKPNTIHGGSIGLSFVNWDVMEYVNDESNPFIVFSYYSYDGEEGFPGNLFVTVTYALLEPYKLSIIMAAEALNKATPVNLAIHNYWNLGGHNSGNVLSDHVQIFASDFTPVNDRLIPTGEIRSVNGTAYDFRETHMIGSRIEGLFPNGYDINYVLSNCEGKVGGGGSGDEMSVAVKVHSKKTGIGMKIWTSAPAMQFYTANFVINVTGKDGYVYQPHSAYSFETQGFPDAVNHRNFPSTIISPGNVYTHVMLHEFETSNK